MAGAARATPHWRRNLLVCPVLVAVYFIVPVSAVGDGAVVVLARAVAAVVLLAVLMVAIRGQVTRTVRDGEASLGGLLAAIAAGLLFFALADYIVAIHRPGQFAGLETRLDALYFALSTLLTVGFGDITAHGQLARGLVCVQLVFNVAVLTSAASVLAHQVGARVNRRN